MRENLGAAGATSQYHTEVMTIMQGLQFKNATQSKREGVFSIMGHFIATQSLWQDWRVAEFCSAETEPGAFLTRARGWVRERDSQKGQLNEGNRHIGDGFSLWIWKGQGSSFLSAEGEVAQPGAALFHCATSGTRELPLGGTVSRRWWKCAIRGSCSHAVAQKCSMVRSGSCFCMQWRDYVESNRAGRHDLCCSAERLRD